VVLFSHSIRVQLTESFLSGALKLDTTFLVDFVHGFLHFCLFLNDKLPKMLHSLFTPLTFAATATELTEAGTARESRIQGRIVKWMQFSDDHFGFLNL
jgi:hypothetical protein